ncbi:FapA family protein, partial [Psychrobacter sp. CAL346-MNA-CIBAN-0220]
MEPGTGTSLHPKDQHKLIATVSGQPVENRSGMQVDDMLQIKDVDVRYGHVNFKGSVLITGDVHEGM